MTTGHQAVQRATRGRRSWASATRVVLVAVCLIGSTLAVSVMMGTGGTDNDVIASTRLEAAPTAMGAGTSTFFSTTGLSHTGFTQTGFGGPIDGFTFSGPDTSRCVTSSRYEQILPYHNPSDPISPVRKLFRRAQPEPTIELDTIWYAGTYELVAVSYDGYINRRFAGAQEQEVWRVEFLSEDGRVVATSDLTMDLEDGVDEASWEGSIGTITLDELAVALRISHGATTSGANSAVPICLSGRLTSGPGPALFPHLVDSWGHLGTLGAQFNDPRDMAIGPDGNLYVADTGNHRIQVLRPDGTLIFGWGLEGTELPAFENPFSIDVTESQIYVADHDTSTVSIYGPDGILNDFVRLEGTAPSGVAADRTGTMFVADSRNNTVLKVDSAGEIVARFGQFTMLVDVAISSEGEVYATDDGRVQIFDTDGQLLRTLSEAGPGDALGGGLRVGLGHDGDVFVSGYFKDRIVKFDRDGKVEYVWGQNHRFDNPSAVAVDADGEVFVLQSGRPFGNRVDRFDFIPAP